MPILCPIITKTYKALFCDMVYKSARDALSHISTPLCQSPTCNMVWYNVQLHTLIPRAGNDFTHVSNEHLNRYDS